MTRFAQTFRGIANGLSIPRTEISAPDLLSPLSRIHTSWDASSSPFDQWCALEFRILTPPSNEGLSH
jgi:hypothetical protein